VYGMLDHINLILEATYVNNTEIMCKFPSALPPNSYKLSVSNNGQDYLDSSMPVRVVDPFEIHFIEPPTGSPKVTKSASLRGYGFESFDGLVCLVNNVHVVPLHFVDSEEIEYTLPSSMSPGVLSVSL
jgi:hypothetical protein